MSWQASIDARLVARLLRTRQPGLIGTRIARRILDAVEQMTGRLPLLARFPRRSERSRAGEVAIVHALPVAPVVNEPSSARIGAPSERALPVVRALERAHGGSQERNQGAHERANERVNKPTIVELAAPAPQPSLPPSPIAAVEPAARTEPARPAPDPSSRRSRMGAPLASAPLPHTPPSIAPTPRVLANQPAAREAPVAVQRGSSSRRATESISAALALPRRTPTSATAPVTTPRALVHPTPRALPAPRDPIVQPERSPIQHGAALAHVAPSAPPARPSAPLAPPAPRAISPSIAPSAAPRTSVPASPPIQPLQRTDLPEIAAHVQRLIAREAQHDRARRGLRR